MSDVLQSPTRTVIAANLLADVTSISTLPDYEQLEFFISLAPHIFLTEDQIRSLFLVFGSDLLFLFTLLSGETVRFPPPSILRRAANAYNDGDAPVDIHAAAAAESTE